jgi:hypothetical protein
MDEISKSGDICESGNRVGRHLLVPHPLSCATANVSRRSSGERVRYDPPSTIGGTESEREAA